MMQLQRPLATVITLARTYGVRGLARRAVHEIRKSIGLYRARPSGRPHNAATNFRLEAYRVAGAWNGVSSTFTDSILDRGHRVLAGLHEAYGHEWRRLPERTESWRTHFRTGYEFKSVPWWKLRLLPSEADVKDVWEPGRFTWVYDLVRANAVTPDTAYAQFFHSQLAAWIEANPPFYGPQWACGQETAIRALAMLHAEANLTASPHDDVAAERLQAVLVWSAERIDDALGYGLSQRNNHGISEAAGLIHLGLRLRDVHPCSKRWLGRGISSIEEQITDQFADDGWYAQHSFTYMRVALEQALLAQRALTIYGMTLSSHSLQQLTRAYDLLTLLVDECTGVVPNHGANDGARTLPYSSASYRDFRPILTLASLILRKPLPTDIPADPDTLHWLGVSAVERCAARTKGVRVGSSGWACVRIGSITMFLRAGTYTHRPSHSDALHLDVRFGRTEVITDPGTFAYNALPPWRNALTSAVVHNGPVLDRSEPAARGPRFLWYSWPHAKIIAAEQVDGVARVVAEIPGRVKREIEISEIGVRVEDTALDPSAAHMQVTWLLHPSVADHDCIEARNLERIAAKEGDITGWFSESYGVRVPSTAIRIQAARGADRAVKITTRIIGPTPRA
jgi:hypothetical protein